MVVDSFELLSLHWFTHSLYIAFRMADVFIISSNKLSENNMQPFTNSNDGAIVNEKSICPKISTTSIAINQLEYNVLSEESRCRTNSTSGFASDITSLGDMETEKNCLERPSKLSILLYLIHIHFLFVTDIL